MMKTFGYLAVFFIALLLLWGIIISPSSDVGDASSPNAGTGWWEGGDLHNEDLAIWSIGTADNKLATSADFIMAVYKDQIDEYDSFDAALAAVRGPALLLSQCLDEQADVLDSLATGAEVRLAASYCISEREINLDAP